MPRTPIHSWPDTLTDWCVIRAFEKAGCPGCLRRPPALAAGFVAEVSTAISIQTFSLRAAELVGVLQAAAESAYEQTGGSTYCALRDAAMVAEDAHLQTITRHGGCPQRLAHRERCEAVLAACREHLAAPARVAQHRCARAYWAEQRREWLRPDLFAQTRYDNPVLRLATIAPVWWALFVRYLYSEFSRRDLTSFHLLDELPRLRQQARMGGRKVLAALVEDWRITNADELGLPARLHYHVLERRGLARARYAHAWFRSRFPGYAGDYSSHAALRAHLESLMPVSPLDWPRN